MMVKLKNSTMEIHHTTREARAVSELLEDAGNCREDIKQEVNLNLLSDSLFSEQQKLRHALDWAHRFLSSGSEVYHELCRADSLIFADEKHEKKREKEKRSYNHPSAAKYHRPVFCPAGTDEVFEGGSTLEKLKPSNYMNSEQNNFLCRRKPPLQEDLHISFSFTQGRDEVTWPENRETENMKSMGLQRTTNKQTPTHGDCRTSRLHICNQTHQTNISDSSANETLASDAATSLIKETYSCWCDVIGKKSTVFGDVTTLKPLLQSRDSTDVIYKAMVEVEKEKTDARLKENDGNMHSEHESNSSFMSHSEPEKIPAQTANPTFSCPLEIPSNLTVYEQYQLCVDQLHHFRQSQHIKPGCSIESTAEGSKTPEEAVAPVEAPAKPTSCFELNCSTTNPEIKKQFNKARSRMITEEWSSGAINKNQDRTTCNRYRETLIGHRETKHCDNLTMKESRPLSQKNTANDDKHCDFIKRTSEAITSTGVIKTPVQHSRAVPDNVPGVEESATLTANSVLLLKKTELHPGPKCHQSRVKGQKETTGDRGPQRLCGKSRMAMSSLTNGGILPRSQSAGAVKHTKKLNTQTYTKRHTPEDRVKHASPYRDTQPCLQSTETHTCRHDGTRPTSPASGTTVNVVVNNTDCGYSPAGVPVCDRWLCLPDEVWLSILSLLPPSDLCRSVQVCRRLLALATDHTLWKTLRIENSNLTEQLLLFVGKRRPRSLSLYSCSGLSVTSCGLEMFFTLCGNSLEEVKVTSCSGPGLHGDQMLCLIGQLCDHVTSVDVSWSGATDTGVKALSDGCGGSGLKSVVLNGCHVTDDPLKKLIMRHKESLSRLEVFGCQFLTPSCLQKIFEVCPDLKHLNIGQVPKVNKHSFTVMTSHLKCLISLNLTGLQAVTDATVDTLLQNGVKLQSFTLSSCPGVTDLTLHNISKYTPFIRYLDISGCKAVTDAGVQSLSLGCRRLQQLDLSSTGTGNRGVTLLANYCSGHLHTVKLSFCHITSENILKLCRRCKRLKVLHFYGCAHVPTEREIREVNTFVKVYPLP
ncbi:uncharacterized protein LOC130170105 isoform X2 [Seriola aureovittata]|uniref:uncharacterized protein LOC130170105 isoform X2 n=1 Tax=Seriola aureovittata TaxID=2871759 RepID=UPI0024BDB4EF|nr:uncharacterized protein LOC130170105 isoform X2 [Seriola aureovittata]